MRLTIDHKAMTHTDGSQSDEKVTVHAVLSRRNLLTLLTKLDMEGSGRTIYSDDAYLPTGNIRLAVSSEEDEEHYANRPFPPGAVHPQTEADIQRTHNGSS